MSGVDGEHGLPTPLPGREPVLRHGGDLSLRHQTALLNEVIGIGQRLRHDVDMETGETGAETREAGAATCEAGAEGGLMRPARAGWMSGWQQERRAA
ncbi:hypothetical protein Aau02nite_83640 [Amorphoplanes auranticolor]|uniref:Uncharacterized protein n=1 Tax=Actinoplanes auranticolor TaxID=47988 RepID=A0A919SUZ3_9ACTN|nr:hypothetical protein Aau02nite_83640 [Actinoplanes auranticolor]